MPTNPLDSGNWGYSDVRGFFPLFQVEKALLKNHVFPFLEISQDEVERRLKIIENYDSRNRLQNNQG